MILVEQASNVDAILFADCCLNAENEEVTPMVNKEISDGQWMVCSNVLLKIWVIFDEEKICTGKYLMLNIYAP